MGRKMLCYYDGAGHGLYRDGQRRAAARATQPGDGVPLPHPHSDLALSFRRIPTWSKCSLRRIPTCSYFSLRYLVRFGAARMRWRDGDSAPAAPLVAGSVYEVNVDVGNCAHVFAKVRSAACSAVRCVALAA